VGWLAEGGNACRLIPGGEAVANVRKLLSNKYLLFFARCVLGLVFVFASIEKIASPEAFAISVEAYRILPLSIINLFALLVPWLELLCGLFLIAGYHVRGSSLVATLLLAGFTLAILSAMARGLTIDCGCFGAAYQTPVTWSRVLEDLGLIVLGWYVFLVSAPSFMWENGGSPAVAPRESTPAQ
jgi:putative oxidoreductase